jgi:hypothetical protein
MIETGRRSRVIWMKEIQDAIAGVERQWMDRQEC